MIKQREYALNQPPQYFARKLKKFPPNEQFVSLTLKFGLKATKMKLVRGIIIKELLQRAWHARPAQ